jgi:hypothetical protein
LTSSLIDNNTATTTAPAVAAATPVPAPHHYLSIALLDFVNSYADWKVYLNPHCTVRDIIFRQIYIAESFDREAAIREILRMYIPMHLFK